MSDQLLRDPAVLPHLAGILAIVNTQNVGDVQHLSNLVKQTQTKGKDKGHKRGGGIPFPLQADVQTSTNRDYIVGKVGVQGEKLRWAGYGLTREEISILENQLRTVGDKNQVKEIRFWGKILGTERDYYVLQGVTGNVPSLQETVPGGQKRGEGVNYHTFWTTNSPFEGKWTELPLITPAHVKTARKIKKYFSGNLEKTIDSFPAFEGLEKHYLKAQLVRMTNSLEITPKGIYKPNDENPKLVEFEDEPKVPEFAQLATLQTWVHRNQNVLHLGRCTHYLDPLLPEDQIEAATAQLTEKDPQIERLRGITEDKLPQGSPLGVENIWQLRVTGDSQIFQKQDSNNVYGTVVLRNIYWPGWVTVGYKGGYANHYIGYGVKSVQPAWSNYQNNSLGEQPEDTTEYREPNPKDEPKPVAEPLPEQPVQE